jgi:very-short-patch-repair endonuclease
MDAALVLSRIGEPVATRAQLIGGGASARDLTAAVRAGRLLRVREGYYAWPAADPPLLDAVRVGGRLGCVSAAQRHGIWVAPHPFAHVSVDPKASRLASPRDRRVPLTPETNDGCEVHWLSLIDPAAASVHTVGPLDALVQLIRCQPRELAVAALDSAVFERVVGLAELDRVFAAVPKHLAGLRSAVEPRCMSGIETIIRLELVRLRIPFEPQVWFNGVGTVDFVVAGCVVVETDGRLGHSDPVSAARDYRRDAALAALGYIVVRLNYQQVMFERPLAVAAILGAVRAHRRGPVV